MLSLLIVKSHNWVQWWIIFNVNIIFVAKIAQIQATQQPPPTLVQPVKEESPTMNGHAEETPMETNEEEVTKDVCCTNDVTTFVYIQ